MELPEYIHKLINNQIAQIFGGVTLKKLNKLIKLTITNDLMEITKDKKNQQSNSSNDQLL